MKFKVSVVGAGNVGATTAQRIYEKGHSDVVLVDIVEDMPNLKVKPKDKVKPYPDEWTFSYKWHDRVDPRFDRGRWDFSRGEGSIAVFHGKPNPHESDQDWVKNNWK